MFCTLIKVTLGGARGAMARYLTVTMARRLFGVKFFVGSMAVNVVSSFYTGILAVVFLGTRCAPQYAHLLIMGFSGAFTTFSFDTLKVLHSAQGSRALAYAGGPVLGPWHLAHFSRAGFVYELG
ncbi:MAG: CrcB protein [Paracoccaceae bacterium]|jgi:CrcB protein